MQEYRAYIMGPDGHVQNRALICGAVMRPKHLAS